MNKNPALSAVAGLAAALAVMGSANAGVIVDPTAASSAQGSYGFPFDLAESINQNGMSAGYTSLVTSFAAYTATATNNSIGGFTNQPGGFPQTVTFTLPSKLTIDAIAFWAANNPGSVTQFELLSDTNAVILSSANAGAGNGGGNSAQDFSFAPVSTGSITMVIENTAGGSGAYPGIGQVAFDAVAAPEPASMILLGAGLFGLGLARRRR